MKPVDLDGEQIKPREIGGHELFELVGRQGHEVPRRRRFRQARSGAGRHVALREPHRTGEFACRDVDQHLVHRPATEPVFGRGGLPTRYRDLTAAQVAHPRPFDRDLAAVETQPTLRPPPSMSPTCRRPGMARAAGRFNIGFHHRAERLYSCRKAEPLEALADILKGLVHRPVRPPYCRCAISRHGVAFLSWNQHPEPNGSRQATPPSHFQQPPGHPHAQAARGIGWSSLAAAGTNAARPV